MFKETQSHLFYITLWKLEDRLEFLVDNNKQVYPFIREPRVRIETNLKLLFRGSFGGEGKLHAG